jgi:uncharacterized protein (DUF924 family)
MSQPTATVQEVLDFWFGLPATEVALPQWFRKDPAFDAQIAQRFGPTLAQALVGGLDAWQNTPASTVALVVVLDQFTRNTRRNTPGAFAGDARALRIAQAMVARGDDRQLDCWQRSFVYLPFEHAEDLAAQAQALKLFADLALEHPTTADQHRWAVKHAEIIEQFGRYPHRNLVLGRVSTPQELLFLAQPGSSF